MTKSFRDSLPAELVHHVTAICGRDGEEWIDGLENNVRELEALWSIKAGDPFAAGEYNFVAPATCSDGEFAVLKLAPPYKTIEIFSEAKYLREHDGKGVVRLIEENRERKAILIEHAFPGRNLTECFMSDEPRSVEPAIRALQASLAPPPADTTDVTPLDEWFDGLRRFESTKFPAKYGIKALELYERLSAQQGYQSYLHGDFHPGNLVSSTRAPFLIIDPKGISGHIGYDIACFLNNLHWWQEKRPDVEARLDKAVSQFAEAFDIDALELRQWAYSQMVLGAWWNFDEMPDFYDNQVAKADVWKV